MNLDWQADANCLGCDTETVFVFRSSRRRDPVTPHEIARLANALTICHRCPVRQECEHAMLHWPDPPLDVVIAGLTPREARRRWFDVNADGFEHGTDRGYQTHKRRGLTPCDPCRTAHNWKIAREQTRARWRTA